MRTKQVEQTYALAKSAYAEYGVNTDAALARLGRVAISLNAWQGDDVVGFENMDGDCVSEIAATGNYPGRARTADELRADLDKAIRLIPCRPRVNLHAFHAELGAKKIERNEYGPRQFSAWVDWAKSRKAGLDFNGTFFNHPMVRNGFTLSSRDPKARRFWVEHGIACRRIGAFMGKQLGSPSIVNVWVPDGFKDIPADRRMPRELLVQSLDEMFKERLNPKHELDALEGKLFGIGAESYTVGSHELYLAYAVANKKVLCMDTGHYHPTESVADKVTSVMSQLDRILLHVSRGVRWDSDHVVVLSDELRELAAEIVRGDYLDRVHIGLDFFDATINRVAAWVIGARATMKAMCIALLEPSALMKKAEARGDYTTRLALIEEMKGMPFGAVWNYYCLKHDVPAGGAWLDEVKNYEKRILAVRG